MRRTAVITAVLLAALNVAPWAAYASVTGRGRGTTSASSGTWGVAPAATSVTSAPPCLTTPSACTSYSASGILTADFNVWNTGGVDLTGVTYGLTTNGSVSLSACSVSWSIVGTCSGTTTTILTGKSTGSYPVTLTAAIPTAPGNEVHLQVAGLTVTVTITTLVCSCLGSLRQIDAAQNTNS